MGTTKLMLSQRTLWEARWVDHLRSGIQEQPGQPGETLSLLKIQKISRAWWQAPVIPATPESEAGELLEPGRQRLQWSFHSCCLDWSAMFSLDKVDPGSPTPGPQMDFRLCPVRNQVAQQEQKLQNSIDGYLFLPLEASSQRGTCQMPAGAYLYEVSVSPCWEVSPNQEARGLECSGAISAHCSLRFLASSNACSRESTNSGMGSSRVAQGGLELLASSNLPASASQSAGITCVSHCALLEGHSQQRSPTGGQRDPFGWCGFSACASARRLLVRSKRD
ncbi:hypothetical protein AAY473_037425 [Plecturocebus cupreus]